VKLSPEQEFAQRYSNLAYEQVELTVRLAELGPAPAPRSAKDMERPTDKEVSRISDIGIQAVAAVDQIADKRLDIAAPLRRFMLERGITRPARKLNPAKTTFVLNACMAVEATGTAALLVSDGTMGVLAGLLTGTVFSAVNVALGVATGYFGLRGMAFSKEAAEAPRGAGIIRALAAAGTALACTVMGTMHLSAARVRVVGDHAGIWDFEKVSLLGTFGDYNAAALLVLGALSSALAIREGREQLSDPIRGYSRVTKETKQRISEALDSAYDEGVERLETAYENASERLDTLCEADEDARDNYLSDIHALRADIERFNCDVKIAVSELKTLQAGVNKQRQYVEGTGREIAPVAFDLAALRQLIFDVDLISKGDLKPHNPDAHMARLDEAFERASDDLRAAHVAAGTFITMPFSTGHPDNKEQGQ